MTPYEADRGLISIHAPLRGRLKINEANREELLFQSTPPCGGDTPLLPAWQ